MADNDEVFESEDTNCRFRIDRISSTIPEDGLADFTEPNNSSATDQKSNKTVKSRRSSSLFGLGGNRKKSVNLPNESQEDSPNYGTVYGRNFSYYTREALPVTENYMNKLDFSGGLQRPTLDELRSEALYATKVDIIIVWNSLIVLLVN